MFRSVLHMIAMLAVLSAAAEVSDAEYAKLREAALNRPRRIFADNDGCDVTNYPKDQPLTKQGVNAYMNDWIKGCEVDVLTYCPTAVGFMMSYPTKVSDRYYTPRPAHWNNLNQTRALEEMGTDGLQIAVEFARANNIEILANMRINDQHERWARPSDHAPFKQAHRELLIGDGRNSPPYGSWVLFDFNHKIVRDRFRGICKEMVTNYDVDGLIVDFYRHPVLFPSVAAGGSATDKETALVTQIIRDLRADCDAAGKKSGRYRILTIRVPDSAASCRALGIDLDTICREKLIDFLVVGGDDGLLSPRSDAVKVGRDRGLKTYISIDARNGSVKEIRDTPELYAAMAAAAFAGGADGLYYFNCFYHKWMFKGIRRDPRDLRFADKSYWGRYHRLANYSGLCDRLNKLAATDGTDLVIEPGKPGTVMLEIGDDFTDPEVAARKPEAELTVYTARGLPPLSAVINGQKMDAPVVSADQQHFHVPVSALCKGQNRILFSLEKPAEASFDLIHSGRVRVSSPWRRLWPFYIIGKTEQIGKEYARLEDCGTEPGNCMNLYYPLPASVRNILECKVDLKVEYSTAPEAVMVRLANDENVEVITFEPDRIGFKFAGKSCRFTTTDRFHTYHFRMKSGRLELLADGKKLLEAELPLKADDPRARFTGNNDGLPHMYERSLIIGSISEPGTGAALWKDLYLRNSAMVKGVELDVRFPAPPDPEILRAIGQPGTLVSEFSVSSGAFQAGWKSNYAADRMKITPQKTLLLDNGDPDNPNALISCSERSFLKNTKGILRIRWQVRPGDTAGSNSSFQLITRTDRGGGKSDFLSVALRPGALISPWKTVSLAGDISSGELYYNFATRSAAVVVDGRIVASGKPQEVQASPLIFFGDGGSRCGGSAEVMKIDVELIEHSDPVDPAIVRAIGKPGKPVTEFSAKTGSLPADWKSGYAADRVSITPQKTVRVDNTDPQKPNALFSHQSKAFLDARSGILRVSWSVTPGDTAGAKCSFQLYARPDFGGGKCGVAGISLAPGKLTTPWKSVAIGPGKSTGEIYCDLDSRTAAVVIDGKIVANGAMQELKAPALVFLGDGGSSCGGSAEIDYVRIETMEFDRSR